MAEPRAIPFLLRLLVAWITYYYTIFLSTVAKSFVGMIDAGIFDDSDVSSESEGEVNRENRRHCAHVRRQRFQLWVDDLEHMRDDDFRDIFCINRAILEHIKEGMYHYLLPAVERNRITMDAAILVSIKYLASGISYVDMSFLFVMSKTL
ncbi:unnamed protein product [Closterium sp. NIES-53]